MTFGTINVKRFQWNIILSRDKTGDNETSNIKTLQKWVRTRTRIYVNMSFLGLPVVAVGSGAFSLEPVCACGFLVEGRGFMSKSTGWTLGTRTVVEVVTVIQTRDP